MSLIYNFIAVLNNEGLLFTIREKLMYKKFTKCSYDEKGLF